MFGTKWGFYLLRTRNEKDKERKRILKGFEESKEKKINNFLVAVARPLGCLCRLGGAGKKRIKRSRVMINKLIIYFF